MNYPERSSMTVIYFGLLFTTRNIRAILEYEDRLSATIRRAITTR